MPANQYHYFNHILNGSLIAHKSMSISESQNRKIMGLVNMINGGSRQRFRSEAKKMKN